MRLIFVHGWSVTNTDTYGELPEALGAVASSYGLALEVQHLYLGKYVSFHDEVTLDDIARALNRALRDLPGNDGAYDFVFDTCANRQTLKCLTIVDEWTRECLAIDVAGSIRSGRVIDVLGQLVSLHGAPRYLRSACYEQVVKALGAVGPSNRGTDTGSGSVEPAHRASSGLIPEERRVPGGSTSSCLRREGLRTTVGMASSPVGAGASGFYAAIDSSLHTWSASNAVRFLTTANA